jgi:hypothetical protein
MHKAMAYKLGKHVGRGQFAAEVTFLHLLPEGFICFARLFHSGIFGELAGWKVEWRGQQHATCRIVRLDADAGVAARLKQDKGARIRGGAKGVVIV